MFTMMIMPSTPTKTNYVALIISALLPFFIVAQFVPKGVIQLDLLGLWVVAMLLVGLPLLFLEMGLSWRVRLTQNNVPLPWQGLQIITRQSDAPMYWRVFAPLSVFLLLTIAALIINQSSLILSTLPELHAYGISSLAVSFVLAVVVLFASFFKARLLSISAGFTLVLAITSLLKSPMAFAITPTHLGEWAWAVLMSLFTVGSGLGLYWFSFSDKQIHNPNPHNANNAKHNLSKQVLPIWLTQLIFGAVAIVLASVSSSMLSGGTIFGLILAAFLVYAAQKQLNTRFGFIKGIAITIIVLLILSALPSSILLFLVSVVAMIAALILSVFAGFVMKISHLRKSLNFATEVRYNIWRVLVRFVVPIALLSALVGLFL